LNAGNPPILTGDDLTSAFQQADIAILDCRRLQAREHEIYDFISVDHFSHGCAHYTVLHQSFRFLLPSMT
jgi:hypothetical protein